MSDPRRPDLFNQPIAQSDAPTGAHTVLSFSTQKRRRTAAQTVSKAIALSPVNAVVAFPQDRRYSKVQDVATKLLNKSTSRAVDHYCHQVTEAMLGHLVARHVPADQHGRQLRGFWAAVDCEVARRLNRRKPTGGAV